MKKKIKDISIFDVINQSDNEEFSKLSGDDLTDLILLIDEYYIKMRSRLGFDESITFGLELEFENAIKFIINKKLKKAFPDKSWTAKKDASLKNGEEINSPILTDNELTWKDINKVCSIVQPFSSIGRKAGGHIHVGTQVLGSDRESWLNFLKIWSVYENVIFRFAYGEFLTSRPSIERYARPTSNYYRDRYELYKDDDYYDLNAILNNITYDRYHAVNFNNVKNGANFKEGNTIEFRCPNGTLNPIIWQNNVNFFVKLF